MARLAGVLVMAALVAVLAATGANAQDDVRMVEGYKYLYSTDLYKKQSGDVIRSFDTMAWDKGLTPKGMHKCARLCKREGGGGVCNAWTFCWDARRCHLLSRLPGSLAPAKPTGGLTAMAVGTNYNAKCASGYSEAAAATQELAATCKATISSNTVLGDTLSLTASFRNRPLRETYDANQATPADCCALCASLKDKGCSSWTFDPYGWMLDRSHKCQLRQGVNPTITTSKGVTSGVMTQ